MIDYLDADVAYLLGLIVARGTFHESEGVYRLIIEFPYSSLQLEGADTRYDQEKEIKVGLVEIQKRLYELLACDIEVHTVSQESIALVARFFRRSMAWRNLKMILEERTNYPEFVVPSVLMDSAVPNDYKREFLRGFGDVAGNIRRSNRYIDGRHRVRLDILNYPNNWTLPIQLCTLLQEHLSIPVQMIAWGHPNLGRNLREHQVNLFAQNYLAIGFTFKHKQALLEELAHINQQDFPNAPNHYCPGVRKTRQTKPSVPSENEPRLPETIRGKHFDSYWQICQALGCDRYLRVQQVTDEEVEE
ncbi:MAG: hypothetical protein SNJ72_08320 [Fimbriimonadales bacterium]